MKVVHSFKNTVLQKSASEDTAFLITNRNGSYAYLKSIPSSRYQGVFFYDCEEARMFRVIENIEVMQGSSNDVICLKNNFHSFERIRENIAEKFFMPHGFNSLVYRLSRQSEVDLILDVKESYDGRQFGRYYDITLDKGAITIKFTKRTDKKEDSSDGMEEFFIYIAIKFDGDYQNMGKWLERHYDEDKKRNSAPFSRHVYKAMRLSSRDFVFTFGKDRKSAVKECNKIYSEIGKFEAREKKYFFSIANSKAARKIIRSRKAGREIKISYLCALNCLDGLLIRKCHNAPNAFAGLPWFFQFWSRDALVSLKAISNLDKTAAKNILDFYSKEIQNNGMLPNIIDGKNPRTNADSIGWLIKRCEDIHSFNNKGTIKKIEEAINNIIYNLKDGLHTSAKNETWMDTVYEDAAREGERIETQAMLLNAYKFLYNFTKNKKYKILENITKNKVRDKFWNGAILADGTGDFTIRPNIFIAHYIYPELLSNVEWLVCFGNAVKSLWLEWGGLSSIDKSNYLFTPYNTGENPKSYHRGDSWFWINNLAALAMSSITFSDKEYIKKILEASTEEILWHGAVGCHSEISDAKQLSSRGCVNQAWSSAMYIEMVDGLFNVF